MSYLLASGLGMQECNDGTCLMMSLNLSFGITGLCWGCHWSQESRGSWKQVYFKNSILQCLLCNGQKMARTLNFTYTWNFFLMGKTLNQHRMSAIWWGLNISLIVRKLLICLSSSQSLYFYILWAASSSSLLLPYLLLRPICWLSYQHPFNSSMLKLYFNEVTPAAYLQSTYNFSQ